MTTFRWYYLFYNMLKQNLSNSLENERARSSVLSLSERYTRLLGQRNQALHQLVQVAHSR